MQHGEETWRQGPQAAAIRAVLDRADVGDAGALFQRALWQLSGAPLARDLPGARASLHDAAVRGHPDAMLIEVALTANGSGGPVEWPRARALLARAADSVMPARHMLALLDAMSLTSEGTPAAPPAVEDLVPDGSVRRVRRCLTPAECAHIANAAADLLAPAVVADPISGRNIPHPIRTSDAATLPPPREDLVIRAINHRIAAISDTAVAQGEALTILRYQPGQQFRLHSDALPGVGNQRVKTVLLYLNEGYEGGETTFPDRGLTIAPAGGDAIIFANTLSDGRPDARMRHAGLPVRRGVKWLATRWIRARPFDVWQGPESA